MEESSKCNSMFATVRSDADFEGESRARSPSPTDAKLEGESRARSSSPLEGESGARSPSPTDAKLEGESRGRSSSPLEGESGARSPSPTDAKLEGESRGRSSSPLEGESGARSPSPTDAKLEGESRGRSSSPLEGESGARSPSPTDAKLEGESRGRSSSPLEGESGARPTSPTDAMRARAERNRQRARSLRLRRNVASAPARDPGGGFLPEEASPAGAPLAPRPSPLVDPAARPPCLACGRPIALSYLLDTFRHPVCDDCRDADGAHALVTRTEAKAAYLLEDGDLDARGAGPLACVRRRNPHARRGDMRLYLRAQLEARALLVWGDAARLSAERARREAARAAAARRREERRLRALRLAARSSLFVAPRAPHAHSFAPETYDAARDEYSRACACGHTETYEKM